MQRLLILLPLLGYVYGGPNAVANYVDVDYPIDTAELDGSASSGKFFKWKKIGGGEGWRMTNSGSAVATLSDLKPGLGLYELTVTDLGGKEDKREIIVNVKCNNGVCSGGKFQNEDGKCVAHACPAPAQVSGGKCQGCPKHAYRSVSQCKCSRGWVMKGSSCYLTVEGAAALKKAAANADNSPAPNPFGDLWSGEDDFAKLFSLLDQGEDLGNLLYYGNGNY